MTTLSGPAAGKPRAAAGKPRAADRPAPAAELETVPRAAADRPDMARPTEPRAADGWPPPAAERAEDQPSMTRSDQSIHFVHIYVPPPMQGRTLRPPCSEAESHVPHSGQWKPRSSPKRPQHVGEFTYGMDVHKVRCSTCGSVNIGRRKTACGAQMGRQSQSRLGQDMFKRSDPLAHIVIIWQAFP